MVEPSGDDFLVSIAEAWNQAKGTPAADSIALFLEDADEEIWELLKIVNLSLPQVKEFSDNPSDS